VRCPACCAPLQLPDDPPLLTLDRTLDLDRRRSRTPVPAATPPPSTAEQDEGNLGDLSFDAPADDGRWTMAAPPDEADEPVPESMAHAPEVVLPSTGPAASLAGTWADSGPDAGLGGDDEDVDLDAGEDEDEDEHEDEEDGAGDPPAVGLADHVAAQRGKLLSLASIAIAGAAALVAVLSSR
jgi:hypothetical protein